MDLWLVFTVIALAVGTVTPQLLKSDADRELQISEVVLERQRRSGCPNGFISIPGSSACFKSLAGPGIGVSWHTAKQQCLSEGLLLAKPSDSIAVQLRQYLMDYARKNVSGWDEDVVSWHHWVDGKATDGTQLSWQRDGRHPVSTHLFLPGEEDYVTADDYCLAMIVNEAWWRRHPGRPYGALPCSRSWAHALCEDVICGDHLLVNNSSVNLEYDNDKANVVAVYQCAENYTMSGVDTSTCGNNGEWSQPGKCLVTWCPELEQPANGSIQTNEPRMNNEATFKCDPGSKLDGQKTIICQLGGSWSHPPPNCIYIDCGSPENVTDGTKTLVSGSTYLNSIVRYKCDEDYGMKGSAERKCQVDGNWDGEPPMCKDSCTITCTNGQCNAATNTCDCNDGWTGSLCDQSVCLGGCGPGICISPGNCRCPDTYTGLSCDKPVCLNGCGPGICASPGSCSCPDTYIGPSCEKPVCSGGCGPGICVSPGNCRCSDTHTGPSCDKPVCSGGCGPGICVSPANCRCPDTHTGPSCDKPVCSGGCGPGICVGPGNCSCPDTHTGQSCDKPVCSGGCGPGICVSPGNCRCPDTHTGPSCDKQCGGVYNSISGRISHPLRGGNYTNNEDCVWTIRASVPFKITFIRFNTESSYDYLDVRDGDSMSGTNLGNLTGTSIPRPVQITSNTAYLRFTSDGSNTRTGFEMKWEPIDEGNCPNFETPVHTISTCQGVSEVLSNASCDNNITWSKGAMCSAVCEVGYSFFDDPTPKYTCEQSGVWAPTGRAQECYEIVPVELANLQFKITYDRPSIENFQDQFNDTVSKYEHIFCHNLENCEIGNPQIKSTFDDERKNLSELIVPIDTPVYNIIDQAGLIDLVREAVLSVNDDLQFMVLIDYDNMEFVVPIIHKNFKAEPLLYNQQCPPGHAYILGFCVKCPARAPDCQ